MTHMIETILADLYAVDSSLKEREPELRQIIAAMLEARPDTEFSEAFFEDLRAQLLERARASHSMSEQKPDPRMHWLTWLSPYGLVAAAFVLGLLPSAYFYWREPVSDSPMVAGKEAGRVDLSPFAPAVVPVDAGAFGERFLALQPGTQPVAGMGGGGATSDAKLIAPEMMTEYEFIYDGPLPLAQEETLPVYKRVLAADGGERFAKSLEGIGLGLIDASSFAGFALQNATVVQQEQYGLMLSVDLASEQVFLAPHYPEWPNPLQQCWANGAAPEAADACQRQYALKESDIPEDGTMIAAAREFLDRHGVDTADYGEPFVSHDWRVFADLAARQSASSEAAPALPIPEQLSVIFPLMLDGQPVYEGTRGQFGIFVNYDIRAKRVAGLNNLMTRRYQKSEYPVRKDEAALREMLTSGGLYGGAVGGVEKRQIRLGEPQQALMRHVAFDEQGMRELIIPVLLFAVPQTDAQGVLYQDKVVLPLVEGVEWERPSVMPMVDDAPLKAMPPRG